MKKNIIRFLAALLCSFNLSCTDWLTIQPQTLLTAEDMFKTEGGFKDALTGVYIEIGNIYKLEAEYPELLENIACQWDGAEMDSKTDQLNRHEYEDASIDKNLGQILKDFYKPITTLNLMLQYIDNGVIDWRDYSKMKGEILALRAFLHFELIRLWGPMPSSPANDKLYLPYVTKMQIYPYDYSSYSEYMSKLNADFDLAENLLKPDDSQGLGEKSMPYMNYRGLIALRSRLALWEGDKVKAAKYAKMIYDSKNYKLTTIADINDGHYSFMSEAIFGHNVNVTLSEFLKTNHDVYPENLEKLYLNAGTDIRSKLWMDKIEDDKKPVKITIKYNLVENESEATKEKILGLPYIRLAEIYLILIETLELDEANKIYEEFCTAREVEYIKLTNDFERMDRLMLEYRKEFVAEGQLFYAYKRWATKNMPNCARPCMSESYVLPIPKREIDVNY